MAPQVTPDFSERAPLAPGVYRARILECIQKTGKQSGAPYLAWKFGTETMDPTTNKQWVFMNTTLSGKGAQIMKKLIQCVYPDYDGGPFNTDAMIGKAVRIEVIAGRNGPYPEVLDTLPDGEEDFGSFGSTGT